MALRGPATRMLDVGGGPGTFAAACPGVRAEVPDIEAVVPIARRNIEAAGLQDRVTARVGDLRSDDLGRGWRTSSAWRGRNCWWRGGCPSERFFFSSASLCEPFAPSAIHILSWVGRRTGSRRRSIRDQD